MCEEAFFIEDKVKRGFLHCSMPSAFLKTRAGSNPIKYTLSLEDKI